MEFTKLNPNHYIFKTNRLLTANDTVYKTETILGKTLLFWVHGDGIIPLHPKPDFVTEIDYRNALKIQVFGSEAMRERLKPAKYKS